MTQNQTANVDATVRAAQILQKRRENWKRALEALPCPGAKFPKFPYGSMEAAIADNFQLFDGGIEHAFALLQKGYKTVAWRKVAEKNRTTRDDAAEANVEPKSESLGA